MAGDKVMHGEMIGEFIEKVMPLTFSIMTAHYPLEDMEGTIFSVQMNFLGEKGMEYGVSIVDGKEMVVTRGRLDQPNLTVNVPEQAWNVDPTRFFPLPDRAIYDAFQDVKGSFSFEMRPKNDGPWTMETIFNNETEPSMKMSASPEELKEIIVGGPSKAVHTFMSGKIGMEGDMTLLLHLGPLMAQLMAKTMT